MIAGFAATTPLTDYELNTVLPRLLSGFQKADRPVPSSQIIEKLNREGIKITGPRLRKVINHIRTHDLIICLVGDDKGYRIETNPEKIKEYLDGLKSRIGAIEQVYTKMLRQYEKIKNPSHQVDLFGAAKVGKDALDNGAGLGGRQAVLDTPEPGQNQTIASNAPKTSTVLKVEAWWKSQDQN